MKKKIVFQLSVLAAMSLAVLAGLQRLLVPKYMGLVVEGSFIEEYYEETTPHDVLILGNCEAYENISPVALWKEYGITSYIRGSANQLIAQSYYLLEDTLRYETPKAVIFSISSIQQFEQENESYNRMTLDGMRWSMSKWNAIMETRMEDEHMIEYIFPLLRFHSRFSELEEDDFTYYWKKNKVSHNGYYMRADIRAAKEFPPARRRADYSFDSRAMEYLDKMRLLCEEKGIRLILMKAPSLYPVWYDPWEEQVVSYADSHGLLYVNCYADREKIGIDYSHDTYDKGLHMNVYGAEKMSLYWGNILKELPGIEDHRADPEISVAWEEKIWYYDTMKKEQETEFSQKGFLSQFYQEEQ